MAPVGRFANHGKWQKPLEYIGLKNSLFLRLNAHSCRWTFISDRLAPPADLSVIHTYPQLLTATALAQQMIKKIYFTIGELDR
jgi:hypothetical protein